VGARGLARLSGQMAKSQNLMKNVKTDVYASSSFNSIRLKNKLAAQEIAGGHSFEKHVLNQGEFPGWIRTRKQFAAHIENVLNNSDRIRILNKNRTAYWHQKTGTVVIRNPSALDGGTAFQPIEGINYFETGLR
jgi:hypothetical protein